jgi:DNA-binding response OmpR family regulator
MKILVVEDEPLLALSLTEELAGAGHTVLGPAKTVAEGLDLIEADKPELAILNTNLEDGSKGTELAAVWYGAGTSAACSSVAKWWKLESIGTLH